MPKLIWIFAGRTCRFVVLWLIYPVHSSIQISHVTRKPVFSGVRPGKLKPVCTATEAAQRLAFVYTILSKQWTTKMLLRLQGCPFVVRIWHKIGFLMTWLMSFVRHSRTMAIRISLGDLRFLRLINIFFFFGPIIMVGKQIRSCHTIMSSLFGWILRNITVL